MTYPMEYRQNPGGISTTRQQNMKILSLLRAQMTSVDIPPFFDPEKMDVSLRNIEVSPTF